jgi:hypothetical protein
MVCEFEMKRQDHDRKKQNPPSSCVDDGLNSLGLGALGRLMAPADLLVPSAPRHLSRRLVESVQSGAADGTGGSRLLAVNSLTTLDGRLCRTNKLCQ